MLDYDVRFVFVFDGQPHPFKANVLAERRAVREKARAEWGEALRRHDFQTAWSKAVVMSKLDETMILDAKRLLSCMGLPYVEAPGEGEAQAALMASRGDVWAANSRDYDRFYLEGRVSCDTSRSRVKSSFQAKGSLDR